MKYNTYNEVPEYEKKQMLGHSIKWIAKRDSDEVIVVKNDLYDHTIYSPYNELNDNDNYKVYEDEWVAGSGVRYGKIFIFE